MNHLAIHLLGVGPQTTIIIFCCSNKQPTYRERIVTIEIESRISLLLLQFNDRVRCPICFCWEAVVLVLSSSPPPPHPMDPHQPTRTISPNTCQNLLLKHNEAQSVDELLTCSTIHPPPLLLIHDVQQLLRPSSFHTSRYSYGGPPPPPPSMPGGMIPSRRLPTQVSHNQTSGDLLKTILVIDLVLC